MDESDVIKEQTVVTIFTGEQQLYSIKQVTETSKIYREMADNMSSVNVNRGGGNVKGFYAEHMNTAEHNAANAKSGIKAKRRVIDNNKAADANTIYSNNQVGRSVQYKSGYSDSQLKNFVTSGKYDGQILEINPDNPIFSKDNAEKLNELKKLAKEHDITIREAAVTDKEAAAFADAAKAEGKIRSSMGLESNAPVTSQVDGFAKAMNEAKPEAIKSAKSAAGFAAGFSIGCDIYTMIETDMELKEMAQLVAKDAALAAGTSAATAAVSQFAMAGLSYFAPGALSVVESAVGTVLSFTGPMGGITTVVSAGFFPAFITGLAIGTAVTTIRVIHSYCKIARKKMKDVSRYISLCRQCEDVIKKQTAELRQAIKQYYDDWENTFDSAIDNIIKSALEYDADGITDSLNSILSKFNKTTAFSNFDEFDAAFSDENFVLTL